MLTLCLFGALFDVVEVYGFDIKGGAATVFVGGDAETNATVTYVDPAQGGTSFSLPNDGDLRFEIAPDGLNNPSTAAYLGYVDGTGFGQNVVYVNAGGLSLFNGNEKLLSGAGICEPCTTQFCTDNDVTCTPAVLMEVKGMEGTEGNINFTCESSVDRTGASVACPTTTEPLELNMTSLQMRGGLFYWGSIINNYMFKDGDGATVTPDATAVGNLRFNVNFFFSTGNDTEIPGDFAGGCFWPTTRTVGATVGADDCTPYVSVPKNDLKYMMNIEQSVWDLPATLPTPPLSNATRLCFETALMLMDDALTEQTNAVMYFNDDKTKTTVGEWEAITAIAWKDSTTTRVLGGLQLVEYYVANGKVRAVRNFMKDGTLRMCVEKEDFTSTTGNGKIKIDPTAYTMLSLDGDSTSAATVTGAVFSGVLFAIVQGLLSV